MLGKRVLMGRRSDIYDSGRLPESDKFSDGRKEVRSNQNCETKVNVNART